MKPVQGEFVQRAMVDSNTTLALVLSVFMTAQFKGYCYSRFKEPGSCYYALWESGDCAWSHGCWPSDQWQWLRPSCGSNNVWALCWQWPNWHHMGTRSTLLTPLEMPREKQSSHFRGKVRDLVASIQTPIFFAFAVCQKDSRSANMARNIKCGEWYHKTCTNIPKTVISRRRETWACKTVNRCDCIMHTYDESLLNIIHDC